MQSTLNLTQTDPNGDPHDHVPVARVAEELFGSADDAIGRASDVKARGGSDFAAGPSVASVDTTFRAAAVNEGRIRGRRSDRPSMGARAIRAFIGFLLAVCIAAAGFAWQSHGDAARQLIAKWTPQLGLTSSPPLDNSRRSDQPDPPAIQASAAGAQTIDPAQPAAGLVANVAAPPPEAAQSLQSLTAALANAGQEIAQLKASIEQLKASQEQTSRDLARLSEAQASVARVSDTRASDNKASEAGVSEIRPPEPNPRPRLAAPPRRLAAVPPRRPMPAYYPPSQATYRPPLAASAPPLPQAVAPAAVPLQAEPPPRAMAEPDGELAPRPPMPVR